ncbi:MAG: hypothetical protein P1V20_05305 [Verrucomicrobiales bacterium]|nr:hypothetical protein [Verrucomicrobiales bacterium]
MTDISPPEVKPKKTKNFVQIADCKSQFHRFFNDPEAGIFVLKGPFGCGKSEFVRRTILKEEEFANSFKFSAQLSLFGGKDLNTVEEEIIGSLRVGKKGVKTSHIDEACNFLVPVLKSLAALKGGVGLKDLIGGMKLQISAKTLFWRLANQLGFLLVIDDVDRKEPELKLNQVLGFTSSLVEKTERKTKVILIVNEDKLDEREVWDALREKFVDFEFRFHPSPSELAYEYIDSVNLRGPIAEIHEALCSPNIRTMLKIESHVKNLTKFLADKGIEMTGDQQAYAVSYASLFLGAGKDYVLADLCGAESRAYNYFDSLQGDSESEASVRRSNLGVRKQKTEHFDRIYWDIVLFKFFSDGTVDGETLDSLKKSIPAKQKQEEFSEHEKKVYRLLYCSFRDTSTDLIGEISQGIEEFPEFYSTGKVESVSGIVRAYGNEKGALELWKKWLNARGPDAFSNIRITELHSIVPQECHSLIPPLDSKDLDQVNPLDVFRKAENPEVFFDSDTDYDALSQKTPEEWIVFFESMTIEEEAEFESFPQAVREVVDDAGKGKSRATIAKNLKEALRSLAEKTPLNRFRIGKLFPDLFDEKK